MYIGAHISIGKGFAAAVEQAREIGGNTMQFFSRNPRGAAVKALDQKDVVMTKDKIQAYEFGPIVAHAPYIINLASPKDDLWQLAIKVMTEDLARMDTIGVPFLAVHPGSHVGKGLDYATKRIADALNIILQGENVTMVLLETMAGSGTEVGRSFSEIAQIISGVEHQEKVGVCLDTCHLFGAGYDVKDNLDQVLTEFDAVIGLDRLKAVHLNDSLQPLGSKKDRHANIGEGLIGAEALGRIVLHPKLKHLPFLLETPGGLENYRREIQFFQSLL